MRPSEMLDGENGHFATRDVKRGEWIATFSPVRRVGADGGGKMDYSFPIRETGSRALVYVTPIRSICDMNRDHAMNHTYSAEHSNTLITHTGELGTKAQVLVRAQKPIAASSRSLPTTNQRTRLDFLTVVLVAAINVSHAECVIIHAVGFIAQ